MIKMHDTENAINIQKPSNQEKRSIIPIFILERSMSVNFSVTITISDQVQYFHIQLHNIRYLHG